MKFLQVLIFFFCTSSCVVIAQDPNRFEEEIERITKLPFPAEKDIVVFTGSSSIRFWEDVQMDCGGDHVINTGFGGSHMSDLLYHLDKTVLRFKPKVVYIYEGDNDVAAGKAPNDIMRTTKATVNAILAANKETKIHFISAKPSPSRWEFKEQYNAFNALLEAYCGEHENLTYMDVWNPMLEANGRPKPSIFIADSLHMNREGYLIWRDVICRSTK